MRDSALRARLPKSGPYHYILRDSPFRTVHNDSPYGLSRVMPQMWIGNDSQWKEKREEGGKNR